MNILYKLTYNKYIKVSGSPKAAAKHIIKITGGQNMKKIYFKIYKEGKYITTDFTYYIEATKAVYESQGYTIEII